MSNLSLSEEINTLACELENEYRAEGGFQCAYRSMADFRLEAFEIIKARQSAYEIDPQRADDDREEYLCSFE